MKKFASGLIIGLLLFSFIIYADEEYNEYTIRLKGEGNITPSLSFLPPGSDNINNSLDIYPIDNNTLSFTKQGLLQPADISAGNIYCNDIISKSINISIINKIQFKNQGYITKELIGKDGSLIFGETEKGKGLYINIDGKWHMLQIK